MAVERKCSLAGTVIGDMPEFISLCDKPFYNHQNYKVWLLTKT